MGDLFRTRSGKRGEEKMHGQEMIPGAEPDIHGGDVWRWKDCMDFSSNCNPLGTPASVVRAVQKSAGRLRDYPEPYCRQLCLAIGESEQTAGENVICANGAAELVYSLCRAVQPAQALLAVPSFTEYEKALKSVGCRICEWVRKPEDRFRLDESFLDAMTDETEIIFLCNPNNPDGSLTEPALLTEIVEKCRRKGIRLVADECFLDFVRDGGKYTLKPYLQRTPELFLLKAFTKRLAMAGVRLGYGLCTDAALIQRMQAETQPWSVSLPAQAAGFAALKEAAHIKAGREITEREREYLTEGLGKLGWTPFPSAANHGRKGS